MSPAVSAPDTKLFYLTSTLFSQTARLMGRAVLFFGTAGIPHSAKKRSSIEGIVRIRALGLTAMELQFVRRVAMGEESAHRVCHAAKENGVRLSAHAPYYINFNSKDAEIVKASRERLLEATRIAALCGARSVVFHAASYHHDPPPAVYQRVKAQLQSLADQVRDEGRDVCLRPETSGRPSQFGDLDEVLRLSAEVDGVSPCIDFGHVHARTAGALNTYAQFGAVLDRVRQFLGDSALQDMHIHVQGMAYSQAGEQKHLDLAGSDLQYEALLQALVDWNVSGTAICESPNLEKDAVLLKNTFCQLRNRQSASRNGSFLARNIC
jgi:deoxyribonuclease-4